MRTEIALFGLDFDPLQGLEALILLVMYVKRRQWRILCVPILRSEAYFDCHG